MSVTQKTVCVLSLLLVVGYVLISILNDCGVLENTRPVEYLLCTVFCLGFGFINEGTKRIAWFAFSGFTLFACVVHWIIP